MARFGLEKEPWLRGFLELPAGIPSHDTFRAVLSALDAKQLARTLIDWTERVREKLGAEVVAIDGKSARRNGSNARAALHLINAWAVDKRPLPGPGADGPRKATRSPPCYCCCANSNWPAAL